MLRRAGAALRLVRRRLRRQPLPQARHGPAHRRLFHGFSCGYALALMPQWGVFFAAVVVFALSLGFALTQPLFAGIVTDLGGQEHMGQAMGLNVFMLFNGFGLGALLFGQALAFGLSIALLWFALGELLLAAAALRLFRREMPGSRHGSR